MWEKDKRVRMWRMGMMGRIGGEGGERGEDGEDEVVRGGDLYFLTQPIFIVLFLQSSLIYTVVVWR